MKILKKIIAAAFICCLLFSACTEPVSKEPKRVDFNALKGIKYFEVSRKFSNGLSFDTTGFQLEPSWILEFLSNDSVAAWSPEAYRWHNFEILFDHDSVYNFVHEFFRVKQVTKDSIKLQRLEVNNMQIAQGYRSDVNITYYSRDHIFNKLKTSPEVLQRPSRADTIFIKELIAKSDADPGNPALAFDARKPVAFIPLSNDVSAKQIVNDKLLGGKRSTAATYMSAEYKIEIKNAYKDFVHLFSTIVDAQGNFHITKAHNVLPGDAEPRKRLLKGIADVYFKNLFKLVPGSTLGIPHSSEILIYVKGTKGKN